MPATSVSGPPPAAPPQRLAEGNEFRIALAGGDEIEHLLGPVANPALVVKGGQGSRTSGAPARRKGFRVWVGARRERPEPERLEPVGAPMARLTGLLSASADREYC